jgi:hypothetical protein
MNTSKDWKAKLESAYSFMLKYSKITVCHKSHQSIKQPYRENCEAFYRNQLHIDQVGHYSHVEFGQLCKAETI